MTCIEHNQVGNRMGYGWSNGKSLHRVAYCQHHGVSLLSIAGLVVRHTCDNPRCVNPEHLVLGTQADNMRDKAERHRASKHRAKLTYAEVLKLRSEYAAGGMTQRQLASKYGVSQTSVNHAIHAVKWKHP